MLLLRDGDKKLIRVAWPTLVSALWGASCALPFSDYALEPAESTVGGAGGASTGGDGGAGGVVTGGAGPGFVASACADGEFATGVTPDGALQCDTIDAATREMVNASCTVYAGWIDECPECVDPPTKWGAVGATSCTLGTGAESTCQSPSLGGKRVQLLGLNTDGSVDQDDMFYYGFRCEEGSSSTRPGPCAAGELLQGYDGSGGTCVHASGPILSFVSEACRLYAGVRDACDECTSAPQRWGWVNTNGCDLGTGAPNTCTSHMLDGVAVNLLGLNPPDVVADDDKFYSGLDCAVPTPATSAAVGACPAGELIVGVEEDGTLHCESPAPRIAAAFGAHCTVYSGWNDQCGSACTMPAKWGRVRVGFCTNDQGNDNTCQPSVLNGVPVETFGLNTDSFTLSDDKFFTGFVCE